MVATATVRRTKTENPEKAKKDDFNAFPDITDWTDEQFLVVMIGRLINDPELQPHLRWDERLATENLLEIVW
jgi:hypothetical protein